MNSYIENLNWRYATKKFDASKKVSKKDLENLLEATALSASSYGLQPYEILVVEDAALRNKLQPAAWGQSQITEASHLIVLANQSTFGEELVDDYLNNVSETRGIPSNDLQGYSDFMKSKLMPLSESAKATWTARQTYIALGNLLSAAADLKIDTCPMEGFDSAQFNEMLGLSKRGLNAAVLVAVGYRSIEDKTQHYKKVRKAKENLITHL
ncbi:MULTISPECIES: NAD(P)H-dependent oxidoreductase [Arenibacter]|uniref:NAD(P)H-dependent oxidoreductase n=1 Tax=Arenibacter TaxID=178469 RepID=UPI0004DF1F88|nr:MULTISPECIES: NAD(P)H-dependent oxidoreductase [Arenibacter]MDX1758858.1 NAD(P)H-dependent oxidoreductase [Arenibacter algicola]GBF18630.1 putative NAD(P)H nitroreductase YfkO [Arenibacter sp. NBRC 103722]|tara:strand:- start:500 stop:1132 length:633 start_codon:yes stop_codon:yes gene_type:complete